MSRTFEAPLHTALFGLLQSLAGEVYHRRAPAGAARPYVIFFKAAGTPRYTKGQAVTSQLVFVVKAVVDGSDQLAGLAVDAALDALLTDGALEGDTLSDGSVILSIRRESDVAYEEDDDGAVIQHVGGTYRVHVRLAT